MNGRIGFLSTGLAALALSACASTPAPQPEDASAPAQDEGRVVEMRVTPEGFEPSELRVEAGEPVRLAITRTTDRTCAKEILIPDLGVEAELPLNERVVVEFTPEQAGDLRFGCGMGQMIGGVIHVE